MQDYNFDKSCKKLKQKWCSKLVSSHLGIEPRTFGLEVQRAILCANGTHVVKLVMVGDAIASLQDFFKSIPYWSKHCDWPLSSVG